MLVTTKQGALMLLSLRVEGRKLAARGAMHLRRAGGAVLSSGMCLVICVITEDVNYTVQV